MSEMNEQRDEVKRLAYHRAAVRTAVVAGVFSAVVCALLLWNHLGSGRFDPVDSEQMIALREQFLKVQDKEEKTRIAERMQAIDVELRRQYFGAADFSRRGAYLLLGGAAVLLVSLGFAAPSWKRPPMPGRAGEDEPHDVNTAARRSVIVLGALLACTLVIIALSSRTLPGEYTISNAALASGGKQEGDGPPSGNGDQPNDAGLPSAEEIQKNWPHFRGPGGQGVSAYTNVPASWDGKTGEGIVWKSKIPLPGENSPVVWENRVFVTGADADKREVYCFDARSGDMLWQKKVMSREEPPDIMEDTGYAASTAATDGRRVYAIFATGDVVCFDFTGKQVWAKALGVPESAYGHSSSLVIHENLLLVLFDQGYSEDDGKSALHALNSLTGETVWSVDRPVGASWATPIVIDTDDSKQIITCANPWVIAYDPDTGAELWRAACLGGDVAPSPVFAEGLLFVCQQGSYVAALRTDGQGDVTETHIAWKESGDLPDICSPLSDGKLLFLVGTYGTVACHDAAGGEKIWEQELETELNSSPSLVGENVYLMDKQGVMYIFKAAREYEEIARAELGEPSNTCPAFLDGRIYIRGKHNLYCIGKK